MWPVRIDPSCGCAGSIVPRFLRHQSRVSAPVSLGQAYIARKLRPAFYHVPNPSSEIECVARCTATADAYDTEEGARAQHVEAREVRLCPAR